MTSARGGNASTWSAGSHRNLKSSGFTQDNPSFAWRRAVDGMGVRVEFMCETDQVPPGEIFSPKEGTGSKLAAFNVRGAMLAREDFVEVEIEGERLGGGGRSRATLRVANVLPYVTLKILAFQDRHQNKDAYDLVYTLFSASGGPRAAGRRAGGSPVATNERVIEAMALLAERFSGTDQDGPNAYGSFLADVDDTEGRARFCQQAVATVREFLAGFWGAGAGGRSGH